MAAGEFMQVSLSGLVTIHMADTTPSLTSMATAASCSLLGSLSQKPAAALMVTRSTWTVGTHGSDDRRKAAAQAFAHRLIVIEPGVIQPTYLIRGGLPTDPAGNPSQTAPTSASRAVTDLVESRGVVYEASVATVSVST
jgi:hypothetical protein